MRIAHFQPDIAKNAASLIRLGPCLGVAVYIIEPCGFVFADKGYRRARMDYLDRADVTRHRSWNAFLRDRAPGRTVLLTTKANEPYTSFAFQPDDTLLLGRESAGVPDEVHAAVTARLRIPLRAGLRSINATQAGAMVLGEALRQTDGFPA